MLGVLRAELRGDAHALDEAPLAIDDCRGTQFGVNDGTDRLRRFRILVCSHHAYVLESRGGDRVLRDLFFSSFRREQR
ncbi:hypothetical protein DB32_000840 [Sandaracinus amylolyticus]|uniref:Uncharacterized protein n=1 Tax=Sandaracinus amylolyticus TaxID=927083 RepID=A0A0F6YH75_9BACT|nr:hypothetical protein DB32_000840 [Sandaracinus amylolyticus]